MKTNFVELFLALVAIGVLLWLIKVVVRNAASWSQDALESFRKMMIVAKVRKMMAGKSRYELEGIALALVLADYHWPVRRSDDEESLAKARARHVANLRALSEQGVSELIERQLRDKHSIFLKTALETLTGPQES